MDSYCIPKKLRRKNNDVWDETLEQPDTNIAAFEPEQIKLGLIRGTDDNDDDDNGDFDDDGDDGGCYFRYFCIFSYCHVCCLLKVDY